ncbi:MAG: methyltransferase domain-containing protein [Bacteroidota bacterium]
MDLKELESGVDPKVHWYYQSKKVPLFRYFKKVAAATDRPLNVIDFGSGSGFFAYELYEAFPDQIAQVLLIDIGYTEEELALTAGQKVQKLRYIPEGIENSIVIMMDVLEHIEDDYGILAEIVSKLGPRAYFFITVPAFQSVWSSHDVYLGHYRRYTLPMVEKLLGSVQAVTRNQYYIYAAIFPAVWLLRRFKRTEENMENPESSDMSPLPGPLNFLLRAYHNFEMNFRKGNKVFGLTCVAEGVLKN